MLAFSRKQELVTLPVDINELAAMACEILPRTLGSTIAIEPAFGEGLWLAGVDDLWWGKPDLAAALRGVPRGAAVVLLSHNPDFAEDAPSARVDLILSGHTHGGQVYLPGAGPLWTPPSRISSFTSSPENGLR